jgi:hypothetical protein
MNLHSAWLLPIEVKETRAWRKINKNLSLHPKRRLSVARRFALMSAVGKIRTSAKIDASENRDTFSTANAELMRCSDEIPWIWGIGGDSSPACRYTGKGGRAGAFPNR